MADIVSIVETVAGNLATSNTFLHGEHHELNKVLHDTSGNTFVLLLPYTYKAKVTRTNNITGTYSLSILFASKSDLDETGRNRYDNHISPKEDLSREFFIRLKSYVNDQRPRPEIGDNFNAIQIFNLFDTNVDGCMLEFEITLNETVDNCL